MWSNRSAALPPLLDGLVKGPQVVVLQEVAGLLEECGVTHDLIVDSGLSAAEARRLLQALYVYSTGFLQMLQDSFAEVRNVM